MRTSGHQWSRAAAIGWPGLLLLSLTVMRPSPLADEQPLLNFSLIDITESAGVGGAPTYGRGVAWCDFDQDGRLDLFVCNSMGRNYLYRNRGGLTFTDVLTDVGLPPLEELTWGAAWIDYDNDGDPDLYLTQGGFDNADVNRLYRNDLNTLGRFTDVTEVANAGGGRRWSVGAAWADYDNDGFLDVYIANQRQPNVLLHNRGDGTFEDVSVTAGVDDDGNARFPLWFDYNRDGWMDIFVPNQRGVHRLYRNNGDGTFTDVAARAGIRSIPVNAWVPITEDFNHDGWFDLYIVVWNTPKTAEPSVLYLNQGDGTFLNVGGATHTGIIAKTMSVQTADLNNDGHMDILMGNGEPSSPGENFLLLNAYDVDTGTLTFVNVSQASGLTAVTPGRSHGIGVADADEDGDLEVYISDGGPAPASQRRERYRGTNEPNHFFLNEGGNSNHWIKLRLVGTVSNRDGIGAEVRVRVQDVTQYRLVKGGSGFSSMNTPVLHIGLGAATEADWIEIHWPSGIVERREHVPADTTLTIIEPEAP